MNRLGLVGVLVTGLMGTLYATDPSFDCHIAKPNSIESVICSSALLSALDREMARLYKLARFPASGPRVEAVRTDSSVRWMSHRASSTACKPSSTCPTAPYASANSPSK
jgi:uncharacterized protein